MLQVLIGRSERSRGVEARTPTVNWAMELQAVVVDERRVPAGGAIESFERANAAFVNIKTTRYSPRGSNAHVFMPPPLSKQCVALQTATLNPLAD